nr:putative reverse transcriptase domain-containing protein [Tanacetum cinerariifolium]
MEFEVGDMVMLKVLPWKGVIHFGKRSKLSLRYIVPFKIIERIGPVAYKLELPEKLCGFHNTFHVSKLKKCLADENLVIPLEEIKLDDKLHFIEEPEEIMDREVKQLKQSRIPIVKVRWNSRRGPEYTWEREDFFKRNYPHLFLKFKLLIDELDLPRSSDFLPFPKYNSFLFEDFSEVDALPSTNNEDKVFNPECLSCRALYTTDYSCSDESLVDKIICDLNKAPDSSHLYTFSSNQRHCFQCKDVLGDGEFCQRCTCVRCGSGLSKGLCLIYGNNQNSLNDSPSISKNSSRIPPDINHHCCYECESMKNLRIAFEAWSENIQQKNEEEEKQIAEEQAEPDNSLSMRDEHLDTILETESDEFKKSSVENLVSNPSESEGEHECDVPAYDDFTTFSNLLFDVDDGFSSIDDESFFDVDISKKIYSNPLFDEEIISMKIDPHHFNVESDFIKSLLNHDSLIISSSSKIDSLLDEFTVELTLLKSIPLGINEINCDPEEEIRLIKKLLYYNSSSRPPEEFISENSDAAIKYFFPSPIPVEDSDSFIEEIDLSFTPDNLMLPGIKEDDYDSERDILILTELLSNNSLSLPENESFYFDIPSSSRPPTKPPDGNSEILNVKIMGDISEHSVLMPRHMLTQPTLVPN